MTSRTLAALVLATVLAVPARAQNFDSVQVRSTAVAGSVYMLTGSGGNIGLSVGDDAVFLVDDQYAPLTPKILAAIAAITPKPVRFVFNTHWHGDHTGGNQGDRGAQDSRSGARGQDHRRLRCELVHELRALRAHPVPGALSPLTNGGRASLFTDI